ncbi:MAG: DUF169 domain-containing protein [Candidatus Omnitrophica bacterium]|nr:DUF169 domain-containing protein [Candidatus Omnitrophota bacterium]
MDRIDQRFSDKFRSHWVKVKFYQDKPQDNAKRLKDVRFCEATRQAVLHPVLLDEKSIVCPGARHAFGWDSIFKNDSFQGCIDKRDVQKNMLKDIISHAPCLKKPFKYIGLNTAGVPDLVMSYLSPHEVMNLIKIYHNKVGGSLDISLCTIMAVCGGIAVRSYLDGKISLSFGCDDSRKYADMRRESLAVGIPRRLFDIFTD